jgi:hypothetical protein
MRREKSKTKKRRNIHAALSSKIKRWRKTVRGGKFIQK